MVIVERKGKKYHLPRKESQRKKSPHGISSKELVLLPAPNVDEVPPFGKASGNGPNSRWLPP